MNETSKNKKRREMNGDFEKFFQGRGIDIGCGNDPVTSTCERFDLDQGDAMIMKGIESGAYDFVHSSHCLEHLHDPLSALRKWWDLLKTGGYLIFTVPDYVIYEHRIWPSKYSSDHKWCFSVFHSGAGDRIGITTLISQLLVFNKGQVLRIQINDYGYVYTNKSSDQTLTGAQAEIEVIIKKLDDTFWTGQ